MKKSGFVGLIGRPNAGKSTLLNTILDTKVAIISSKAQTTRNVIRGVYNDDDSQIVFVDTPGIHKPKHNLGHFMNDLAISTLLEMDVILFLIDVNEQFGKGDNYVLELLKSVKGPVILVLNKIDKVTNEQLVKIIDEYKDLYNFSDIVPISSLENRNVNNLLKVIKTYLNFDYQYYSEDTITDISDNFYIREIIREKVLYHTQDEIPHSIAVVIEEIEEDEKSVDIAASIIVERDSQKGILIGKKGSMIKQIGSEARSELKKYKNKSVHLNLVIKVDKKWRSKSTSLSKYGYSLK